MQSGFTPLLKSSRNQLRVLAVGCVATGGVAALLLPSMAESPAIVPAGKAKKASSLPALPAMTRIDGEDAVPVSSMSSTVDNSTADFGSAPVAKVPASKTPLAKTRSLAQMQSEAVKINIEFRDVSVSELLAMVAMQGDINISIGSDVDPEIKIPYIRLIDVTPAEAIAEIADSGGLLWKEKSPNKFFVGKTLPASIATKKTSRSVPVYEPIDQDGVETPYETQIQGRAKKGPFEDLVKLDRNNNNNNQRAERSIRPLRIRNVRPGIVAWWVDPRHQQKPIEFQNAEASRDRALSPHILQPGVDPAIYAQMNNRNAAPALPFATPYVPGAYQNPYANPAAAAYMSALPVYKSSYQFGFGGGNNNGNNNNNNNNGNNNNGNNGGGGFGFGQGVLELPEGVDQLVAIDSQNVLLVYGTDEGIARLQTIIDYLDRPIRQVEIEAQFIDVSVNESRAFGIQFSNRTSSDTAATDTNGDGVIDGNDTTTGSSGGGGIGAGIPGANQLTISYKQYQAQLNFLSQKGNSRIINSPRITTMNNLSASLQSQQITPILLTSATEGIGGAVGSTQQAFFLTTSVGLQVTPTINNDDTITVFMTPFVQSQVPTPGLTTGSTSTDTTGDDDTTSSSGGSSIPTVLAQSLTTVANVKDNDVIVLGGLRTRTESVVNSRIPILSRLPLIGRLFRSTNKTDIDRELVIFLTARIQRRTEDVTPIQGP